MNKFVTFSDDERPEIVELIKKFFSSLQTAYKPALDLVLPNTVERHASEFIRLQRAAYNLDQAAIAEGYESAADRIAKKTIEEAEKAAAVKAEEEAREQARIAEQDKKLAEQLAEEKRIQEAEAEAAAERQAERIATLTAEKMGATQANVTEQ